VLRERFPVQFRCTQAGKSDQQQAEVREAHFLRTYWPTLLLAGFGLIIIDKKMAGLNAGLKKCDKDSKTFFLPLDLPLNFGQRLTTAH